jgi:hypothetical protein
MDVNNPDWGLTKNASSKVTETTKVMKYNPSKKPSESSYRDLPIPPSLKGKLRQAGFDSV